jgi:ribosome maturation factor RimP
MPGAPTGGPRAHFFVSAVRKAAVVDTVNMEAMLAPSLAAMGYSIVRVVFTGGRRATLQVMAERSDGAAMTVDDCATVSHTVSALLDVADAIAERYDLEVSSPGIDRPLVRPKDYERFAGFEAKIEMNQPIEGRKRFRGKLMGLEGEAAKLLIDDTPVLLPLAAIQRAKLVLTDELIAATNPDRRLA